MLAEQATRRLAAAAIPSHMREALLLLVAQDTPADVCAPQWDGIIPTIYRLLGGIDDDVIQPFAAAWLVLAGALRRLDHLQDGDVLEHPLPTVQPPSAQYNLVLSYYLLATALLDDLTDHAMPSARLSQLRRLWADALLRAASGQQYDLELQASVDQSLRTLEQYQTTAQAKSGAIFALAFAGTATLSTDDREMIAALAFAGEAYGTLLQLSDDLKDAATQAHTALTLPQAYHATASAHGVHRLPHDVQAFWSYVYAAYLTQVEHALAVLAPEVQAGIVQLFAATFEQPTTGEAL